MKENKEVSIEIESEIFSLVNSINNLYFKYKEGTINGGKIVEIKCPEDYPGVVNYKDWVLHIRRVNH